MKTFLIDAALGLKKHSSEIKKNNLSEKIYADQLTRTYLYCGRNNSDVINGGIGPTPN